MGLKDRRWKHHPHILLRIFNATKGFRKEKAIHILELVRSELYMDMPHFLGTLNTLMFKEDERVSVCATNGVYFYYNPLKVIELFQKNSIFLNRAYLHSILHCLYSHIWLRKNRIEFIWNVACDIVVEYTLDSMHKKSVSRILSYARKDVYHQIEKLDGLSCITVYEWLCTRDDLKIYIMNLWWIIIHYGLKKRMKKHLNRLRYKRSGKVYKQTVFDHKQKGKEK